MNNNIFQFDKYIAQCIGYLPQSFYKPFVWLGRLTTPALWASYLLVVQLLTEALGLTNLGLSGWAIIILLPAASLMKLGIRRERPPTIYAQNMKIKSYSFPSSHAYSGMVGSLFLMQTLMLNEWLIGQISIILALIIGISRIYVGAHYPSDVLGGWIMGALVVLGCLTWL